MKILSKIKIQKSCNRCDVIVGDSESIEKLECVDYRSNCDTQSLLEKKLKLPIRDCILPGPNEPLLVKQRKLRYQGLCRKTCDQCNDVIFKGNEPIKSKHGKIFYREISVSVKNNFLRSDLR